MMQSSQEAEAIRIIKKDVGQLDLVERKELGYADYLRFDDIQTKEQYACSFDTQSIWSFKRRPPICSQLTR